MKTGKIIRRLVLASGICFVLVLLIKISFAEVRHSLPVLGDASSSLISPQMEREIGKDFLRQIHSSFHTVRDPILKYYIKGHLRDLAQHSELKENLQGIVLIDSEQINAFAAPGGIVGINLGLMLHARDIHEYSAVMAHELAHLSQRHFARRVEESRANMLPTMASLIAAIGIGMLGGSDAGMAAISASQAVAQSNALRYSRNREQEADRIGLATLHRAGLDTGGMARMFERMQRNYRFTRMPPEFLLTHPLSETRIADAKSHARRYPENNADDSPDYALMRARAYLHYAKSPESAIQHFTKNMEDSPDSIAAIYGLSLANSKAGRHKKAIALGKNILNSGLSKILSISCYTELLINAEQFDLAKKILVEHLKINPQNNAMTSLFADLLTSSEDYISAEKVLEKQSQTQPNDVDVWFNLAEVAGKAGNIVGVHKARAEYFALHGAYQKAISHLEYAKRLTSRTNRSSNAKLDQRITDLRNALRSARSS
ncbi:MAG: peptidase M48 [Gammaproteobacteria bacterium]|nr:peptidase M48 [Gammaproteobacteria bacterium]